MGKYQQSLSGLMIAQNEGRYIQRALDNVLPFVDEMIVVDGGSTDDTAEIAKKSGAHVWERTFDFDFAAQRNFGVEKCAGEWILMLDADEYYTKEFFQKLPKYLSDFETDAYKVRRENVYLKELPGFFFRLSHWIRNRYDWQDRLFRRHLRFTGALHEKLAGEFRTKRISEKMIHDKSYSRQAYSDRFYAKLMSGEKKYPDAGEGFDPLTREKRDQKKDL